MRNHHKHNNQNKFVRIISLPIRVLGKARDLYVRSVTNCASTRATSYSSSTTTTLPVLPKSFSVGSARSSSGSTEDYSELIRAASVRSMGHTNEVEMFIQQQLREQAMKAKAKSSNGFPKSCSVGMGGFMGRIDEEKSSDLSEENGDASGGNNNKKKVADVYSRSRSVAVNNNHNNTRVGF